MVRRRTRRNGPRRRNYRRRRSNNQFYLEELTFSVGLGSSASLTKSILTGLPPRVNFRPLWISVSTVSAHAPADGAVVPSAIQIVQYHGLQACSTSGVQTLGVNPRTVTCRLPRSTDWYASTLAETYQIGILEAICFGPQAASDPAYLRGVLRIGVALQREILSATCPSRLMRSGRHLSAEDEVTPRSSVADPDEDDDYALIQCNP